MMRSASALNDLKHRSWIEPLPQGAKQPLWSVMIPVFNNASDLPRSVGSVLSQALPPDEMQIEVIDDCSTMDDPQSTVAEVGSDRVAFYRQPRNVGHSRNFNTCITRSRGRLVHILHSDDWVGAGFYSNMAQALADEPSAGAAFCRHQIIAPDGSIERTSPLERETPGVLAHWLDRIAAELPLQPPSMVVRRSTYEELGGFDTRMASCGEDWEMWVRIATRYPVVFVPEVLAFYQNRGNSLTKRSIRSGQNIKDVRLAAQIARRYLPAGSARAANRRSFDSWAGWALYWAQELVDRGEYRAAMVQLREALRCSRSEGTVKQAARIGMQILQRTSHDVRARVLGAGHLR